VAECGWLVEEVVMGSSERKVGRVVCASEGVGEGGGRECGWLVEEAVMGGSERKEVRPRKVFGCIAKTEGWWSRKGGEDWCWRSGGWRAPPDIAGIGRTKLARIRWLFQTRGKEGQDEGWRRMKWKAAASVQPETASEGGQVERW
jgi:hypothetical protein